MKTIAEFAKQEDVTTKTIYQRIYKYKEENGDLNGIVKLKDGIKYVTEKGQECLSKPKNKEITENPEKIENEPSLTKDEPGLTKNEEKLNQPSENTDIYSINSVLQKQLEETQRELKREREHSRNLSNEVIQLAKQVTELAKNNQVLLGAEQSRTNPVLLFEEKQKEKGLKAFLKRIMGS